MDKNGKQKTTMGKEENMRKSKKESPLLLMPALDALVVWGERDAKRFTSGENCTNETEKGFIGCSVLKYIHKLIIWFAIFTANLRDLAAAEAVFSRISLPALRFQFIADKTLGQQRLVGCPVDSSWGATGANVPYYHLSLHFGLVGPETIWKYKWN